MEQNNTRNRPGKLYLVGLGPGSKESITPQATRALLNAEVWCGYVKYVDLIRDMGEGKKIIENGMKGEERRVNDALDAVKQGLSTAIISSGDIGVYGMAGLALSLCHKRDIHPQTEIIAGVSAANSAATRLGAPLMCDYAVMSLSDLLVPWQRIEMRLKKIASADLVTVLYNPRSKGRSGHLEKALTIFKEHLQGSTPVGYVKNIGLEGESRLISTLADFPSDEVDMRTTVIIGNSQSTVLDGYFINPRGYISES